MRYTIVNGHVPVGVVDLPVRELTAAPVNPLPGYAMVEATVRLATEAILEFGLFGVAAPRVPPLSLQAVRHRLAFSRAARLELELIGRRGESISTTFLNLLHAPRDGGVIAVVSFMDAPASVAALRIDLPDLGTGTRPTQE
jgi:hypothetical protein